MNNESILHFMQRHDPNGFWLEWLKEIKTGESELDLNYIADTLQKWYNDSQDKKYLDLLNKVIKL